MPKQPETAVSEYFGSKLPDPDTEDRIALDVAAGMPKAAVIGQYGLKDHYHLAMVLEKPRVARRVAGYAAQLDERTCTLFAKRKLAANDALDKLIDFTRDASVADPRAIGVRQWMVDGAAQQRTYGEQDQGGSHVTMEVVLQLGDVTRELSAVVDKQVIDISPDDRHLHGGTKFIEARERDLAKLGKSDD